MVLKLKAAIRTIGTKSDINQMRKNGFIPAVMYAGGENGKIFAIERSLFTKEFKKSHGDVAIYSFELEGTEHRAIIKEKQIHPLTREITHIDFLELHPQKKIHIPVPLRFIGTPASMKEGAILDVHTRKVEITCLPKDIPEDIEVGIAELQMGQTYYAKDLSLGSYELNSASNLAIVSVQPPKGSKLEEEV